MAKSTNGGTTKGRNGGMKAASGESKARRAPARRRTDKKSAETLVAAASELVNQPASAATSSPELDRTLGIANLNPEEVRRRAYELYIRRGRTDGGDVDDWLEAERQLRTRTH